MSDKFPFFAAESGTWKTTSPNPHIDLSGTALTLGTYPAQTFKAAADDATLDFASTNTCTIVVWKDATNWKRYEGAVWTDAATDSLDLSAATLMGAAGTISNDDAISVVASLPVITAASIGAVNTANSPAANEFARFTDADTIEGRTAAEARADLDLEPGVDFYRFMTHSAQTITTADVTGAVNTHYRCTIDGLTADRYLTLPAGAVGDRIIISIVDGVDTHKLGIKGATNITIDGGAAATLTRWMQTNGNFVEYEATSATNWQRISGLAVESIVIACGNLVSPMTTGPGKVSFPMPYAFHLREIIGAVLTAPTGAAIIMDVNEAGTSVMTTNKLLIDATETSTLTASTAPTITDDFLAKGAIITVDFDQVGSPVAGVGPVVELIGVRA